MRRFSIFCAIASLFLAGHAMAQDKLSYNKLDVGLVGGAFDSVGGDTLSGGGIDFNGSWEFAPHVFGFGGLNAVAYQYEDDDDFTILEADFDLGVGVNAPLASGLDVVAGISWRTLVEGILYEEDDDDDETYSSRGVGTMLGLRGLIGRRFTWESTLRYAKLKSRELDYKFANTGLSSGFRVQITRLLGAGMDLGINGYGKGFHVTADQFFVAARFRLQFDDRDGSPQWQ